MIMLCYVNPMDSTTTGAVLTHQAIGLWHLLAVCVYQSGCIYRKI